jgi:hypothetical protein
MLVYWEHAIIILGWYMLKNNNLGHLISIIKRDYKFTKITLDKITIIQFNYIN